MYRKNENRGSKRRFKFCIRYGNRAYERRVRRIFRSGYRKIDLNFPKWWAFLDKMYQRSLETKIKGKNNSKQSYGSNA